MNRLKFHYKTAVAASIGTAVIMTVDSLTILRVVGVAIVAVIAVITLERRATDLKELIQKKDK